MLGTMRVTKAIATVFCIFVAQLVSNVAVAELYASTPEVKELTDKSFPLPPDTLHIVKFYAPWCGHCKNLVPEYAKLAKVMEGQGIVVAALDATKYQGIAQQFGIKGFPDVRVFVGGKAKAYTGERKAMGMANFLFKEQKSFVMAKLGGGGGGGGSQSGQGSSGGSRSGSGSGSGSGEAVVEVDDSSFDSVVLESTEMWMVEFFAPWCGHCKALAPEWQQAAETLQGTGINYAAVDATENSGLAARFGVQGYPTIKMFPPGAGKTDAGAIDYDGPRTAEGLTSWSEMKFEEFGGQVDVDIPELVSIDVFKQACEEKSRCAISILPDIRDSGKEQREKYIEVLKKAQVKARHVPFAWASQNNQPEFEKLYRLEFGFPTMVYLKRAGDKEVGFIYRGKFDPGAISAFLSAGKNVNKAVGSSWPQIATTEPWDGEEAPPLEEDDDDFDLEAFLADED